MGTRKVNTVGVLEVLSKFNRSVRVQRDTMGLQLSKWILKCPKTLVINGQDLKQFYKINIINVTKTHVFF